MVLIVYFNCLCNSLLDPPRSDHDNTQRLNACKGPRILRVSILDSSFNPPTCAHLALARSKPTLRKNASFSGQNTVPGSQSEHITTNENAQSLHHSFDLAENGEGDYDARLLLLSVRNVDKTLKAGDATYEQRIEMMYALARELEGSAGLRAVLGK
jgi:nicotinamide-nucleotide adenylyltransferase